MNKYLLSEEFQEFSRKISEMHEHKKARKEELKKIYDQFQEEFRKMDEDAAKLEAEFMESMSSPPKKDKPEKDKPNG